MVIPKINSAHGSDTRNIINRAIDLINLQGKSIQDLVAEGQLTPSQYATLIQTVNGLVKSGQIDKSDLSLNLKTELDEVRKKNVPISLNDVDPDLLGAIQGGDATSFNLLSIPRKHSVNPSTTTFVSVGKNLFNKNSAIQGYTLDHSGNMIANNDYYVSEYMAVNANETYTRRFGDYRTVFYDSSFNIISAISIQNTFTTPETCAYVRIAIYYTRNESEQLEKGNTLSDYEPYKIDIKELTVHEDVAKVFDDVSQVDQEVKIVNENLRHLEDYKEYEILDKTGSFVSDRPQTSTFSGWAYPFNKDDISGTLKGIKMYVGIGGETDVPAKFIILSDTYEELFSFPITIPETGYVKRELAEPIEKSVLPQTFYVGIVTTNEPNTVLVPPFSEHNPNYNDRGLSPVYKSGLSWKEATGDYEGDVELLGDYKYNFNTEMGTSKVKLSLPQKYELVVGDTFELFYKGIVFTKSIDNYFITVKSSKGSAYERKYVFEPTENDVGTHQLIIEVHDDNNNLLGSDVVELIVKNKATNPTTTKNILAVGDSLTAGGHWVTELHNRLVNQDNVSNINFIGTKGANPTNFEATGGWTIDKHLSSEGAFWNDESHQIDFLNYANSQNVTTIDHVYLLLGWNSSNETAATYKSKLRDFINKLRSDFPSSKVTLIGLQVPSADGFGSNYGATWSFREKLLFVFNLNQWLIDLTAEYSNVDFIHLASQFDSVYNMPVGERPVNVRSSKIEMYGTNGVHPANEGYLQIADAVYRNISHKL